MMIKRAGFTLIELVTVIVLIGILAATALPKFADITGQARTAATQGIAGALSTSVSVAHAKWLATGSKQQITLEKQVIIMNDNGWPEGTTGIATGVATVDKCIAIWHGLLNVPPIANVPCGKDCDFLVSVPEKTVCSFTDQQGRGSNSINYDFATGKVTVF